MKALILMIFSVLLSGVVCLALVNGGIVTINNSYMAELFNRVQSQISFVVTNVMPKPENSFPESLPDPLKLGQREIYAEYVPKNAASENPEIAGSAEEQGAGNPVQEGRNSGRNDTAVLDEEIFQKSMAFLFSWSGGEKGVEDAFGEYLKNEQNLSPEEIFRLMRLCFWKNFVTLQQEWQSGEKEVLRLAFAREKALKNAGFAAGGLSLMDNAFHEAEEQAQIVDRNMTINNQRNISQ